NARLDELRKLSSSRARLIEGLNNLKLLHYRCETLQRAGVEARKQKSAQLADLEQQAGRLIDTMESMENRICQEFNELLLVLETPGVTTATLKSEAIGFHQKLAKVDERIKQLVESAEAESRRLARERELEERRRMLEQESKVAQDEHRLAKEKL